MAKRRRRRRLKKGPVLILLLIIILIVGGIGFYIYTHTSKYLFFKGLEKSFSNLENISFIDDYMPYIKSNYYNKTNSSFEVKTSELDTSIKFEGDIYLNDKSNYYSLNIDTNNVNYGLELFNKDSRLYYKIDDSKYYYTDYENINNYNINDYYDLLHLLINNLSSDQFKANDVELSINSKTYKTRKIMLVLKDDEFKTIMDEFHKDVLKDEDLSLTYMSLLGLSTKDELNDYINNYDISFEQEIITYSIYFYDNEPIMNEIENGYDGNDRVSLIMMDDYFEVRYTTMDDNISYLKIYDNKIDMFLDGIGYGNGKYSDNNFEIKFTDYDNKFLGSISYSIKNNNDSNYLVDFVVDIELSELDYYIDSSNEIILNKEIPSLDTTNSVSIDNILEDDKNTLSELLSTINLIFTF